MKMYGGRPSTSQSTTDHAMVVAAQAMGRSLAVARRASIYAASNGWVGQTTVKGTMKYVRLLEAYVVVLEHIANDPAHGGTGMSSVVNFSHKYKRTVGALSRLEAALNGVIRAFSFSFLPFFPFLWLAKQATNFCSLSHLLQSPSCRNSTNWALS